MLAPILDKDKKFDFISINEDELRLPLSLRFEGSNELIQAARNRFNLKNFLVTRGKKGCTFIKNEKTFKAPTSTTSVKDTVGAGDALFAISSLLTYIEADNEIIPFLSNCAGGIAANIMGNKESVTKERILNFVKGVYKNEMG